MSQDTVIIEQRFNGPPNSGNGGYVCGVLARYLDGTAAVRLKVPPPLDTELRIGRVGDGAVLRDGETVVAEARPGLVDLDAPTPPTYAGAEAAAENGAAGMIEAEGIVHHAHAGTGLRAGMARIGSPGGGAESETETGPGIDADGTVTQSVHRALQRLAFGRRCGEDGTGKGAINAIVH